MPRRAFMLLAALAAGQAWPSPAAEHQPNVILMMADDVGYECFGAYGSKQYSTPNLDRLADSGVRFTNAYSTPLCTPSRVNLMTGKSNVFNYVDFGVFPKGEPTFANHFKAQGYATAVAGKWQLMTARDGVSPAEAGFDATRPARDEARAGIVRDAGS